MTTTSFSITPAAAARILYLLAKEPGGDNLAFRISVSGGGCSGFQYAFLFDDARQPTDHLFEQDGARVIIDDVSLGLLSGSALDYQEDLTASLFVITNPNATSRCGCGNSFSL